MIRIRLVFPACVAPNSTVTAPLCKAKSMGRSHCCVPTFLLTLSRTNSILTFHLTRSAVRKAKA